MKKMMIVLALAAVLPAFALHAQEKAKAPEIKPASAEYSTAFCAGWNAAVDMEAQRAQNWRATVLIGRENDASPAKTLVDGVGIYVMIPRLSGKAQTADGLEVDCTPKPDPKAKKK